MTEDILYRIEMVPWRGREYAQQTLQKEYLRKILQEFVGMPIVFLSMQQKINVAYLIYVNVFTKRGRLLFLWTHTCAWAEI